MSCRSKRKYNNLKNTQSVASLLNFKPLSGFRAYYRASIRKQPKKDFNVTSQDIQSK